jgi:LuxR family maltose regulon positive regulatory protein
VGLASTLPYQAVQIIDRFEVIMLAALASADHRLPAGHSNPLLLTKLLPPPIGAVPIARAQLINQLEQGAAGSLTLLVAPAGYGKTTLLSDWLATRTEGRGLRAESVAESLSPQSSSLSPRGAWLSLDIGDNDPARFWAYVVAALQAAIPGVGAAALGL